MAAGAASVAAMTAGEKLEQAVTRWPNSYMRAHTLAQLLGSPRAPEERPTGLNRAMHWGQGIVLGAVRGMMAERGLRGPVGALLFFNMRLLNDQTLENATGAGSPPWTWPVDEQVIDLAHKLVDAAATGIVADRLIAGPPGVPRAPKPWSARPRPGEYSWRHMSAG
jgi:hypothetical protein